MAKPKAKARPKAKRKRGRPRRVLKPEQLAQLETMAGLGLTWPQIAACLDVPKSTLLAMRKSSPTVALAYEAGRAKAELGVGQALYKKATGGDVAAIRWWEMTRAGRREGLSLAGLPADDEENQNAAFLPVEVRFVDPS